MELDIRDNYVSNALAAEVPSNMSMPGIVEQRAMNHPDDTIIERKAHLGDTWLPITARQFFQQIKDLAAGLLSVGFHEGDVIGILSPTCYEWTLLDLAAQAIKLISVPIYETNSASQVQWIINDAGIKAVFCANHGHEALVNNVSDADTYVFEDDALETLMAQGRNWPVEQVEEIMRSIRADDVATIVYTSGTTGPPRGAMLTHGNLTQTVMQAHFAFPDAIRPKSTRILLFLPLAHIYARTQSYFVLAGEGVAAHVPNTKNLLNDFDSYQPTTIGAVPRVLEKIYLAADAKAGTGVKKRIFNWAAHVADETGQVLEAGEELSVTQKAQLRLARKLVFDKIKDLLGENMKNVVSGGAPLSPHIERFFGAVGLYVYNGYGLTEMTGGSVCNVPGMSRTGSVGVPIPGSAIRIAEDGEILLKGTGVFKGYLHNEQGTKEAITNGWLHTGDLGRIDEDGFLFVTGRKKELIVTASGKNVQPAVLEESLRTHPLISQIMVIGNDRPFIAALVTLDEDMLAQWLANHKLEPMSVIDAADHPAVQNSIAKAIARANKNVSRAESIRKFTILKTDFTEANDLLTPSLKVKRKAVIKRFAPEIEQIYSAPKDDKAPGNVQQ